MSKVAIVTLGCPKNQVDSENLYELLKVEGIDSTDSFDDASIILINTCGFIEEAKQESIDEILDILRYKVKGKKLIVFGCLAQRYRKELIREIPEINAIWGVGQEKEIVEYCKEQLKDWGQASTFDKRDIENYNILTSKSFVKSGGLTPYIYPENNQIINKQPASSNYIYLKIAEGCNRGCNYCVIPSIKGKYRSEASDIIVKNAEKAVNSGIKELILIAQDITYYGNDIDYELSKLIRDIAAIQGDFWIRLLYLYPTSINESLIDVIKKEYSVCNYIDIPLQHSEDRILKAMGRGGSRKYYLDLINSIRQEIPDVILRTTFIVGFPGETEEDFSGLKTFIEEVGFDRLGVFAYSDEEGTPAYNMEKKVSNFVKKRRFDEIMKLQSDISYEKNEKYVGGKFKALIDEIDDEIIIARLYSHAPEIDGNVIIDRRSQPLTFDKKNIKNYNILTSKYFVKYQGLNPGFVDVEITGASEYDLYGRILK